MASPHVFICYAKEAHQNAHFAMQLIDDLTTAGVDVLTLEESMHGDDIVQGLHQKLSTCQWVVLVQTPEALRNPQVHLVINSALDLVLLQRMRGVLVMIATPYEPQEVPPTWTTLKAFDASQDYPRALARLLLTLGLATSDVPNAIQSTIAPPPALQPVSYIGIQPSIAAGRTRSSSIWPSERRKQWWFIPLVILLVVLLVAGLTYFARNVPTKKSPAKASSKAALVVNTAATATVFTSSSQALYDRMAQEKPVLDDSLSSQDSNNWKVSSANKGKLSTERSTISLCKGVEIIDIAGMGDCLLIYSLLYYY